ncbi:MAG TPA: hypothetical protein VN026_07605 [Bacteroidia bacterium]|jgi:hypothetical protein|nr:hypothetical protein [Bacteroidia bacterium]
MRFITFIKSLPKQQDKEVQDFINWAKKNSKFPQSSDPRFLGMYLSNKLNDSMKMGYMKTMMFFRHQTDNSLPKDLKIIINS